MLNTIPHIIHYCWFGKNELPPLEKACMQTWGILKDYKVMRWDETTFDINKSNQYVRDAYKNKKYAFVSDYVRLYALYKYGGVYLDSDMEVFKDFTDIINAYDVVGGFEHDTIVSAGIIAAKPQCVVIKEIKDSYESRHFIKEDGTFDMTPINFGWNATLKKYGVVPNGETQIIKSSPTIFIGNWHYFNSVSMKTWHAEYTDETYTVHHYSGSWRRQSGLKRAVGIFKNRVKLILGFQNYAKLQKIAEFIRK